MIYGIKAKEIVFYLDKVKREEDLDIVINWAKEQVDKFDRWEYIPPYFVYMIIEKEMKKEDLEIVKIDIVKEKDFDTLVQIFQPIGNIEMWGTKEEVADFVSHWNESEEYLAQMKKEWEESLKN